MNLDTSKPIKSVSYNGVDVPVYNPPEAPVLLWTNASPTSSFVAQTVSFDGEYGGYLVEVRASAGKNNTSIGFVAISSPTYVIANGGGRAITNATSNSIVFGTGGYEDNFKAAYNGHGIPTRIWGVKFTL